MVQSLDSFLSGFTFLDTYYYMQHLMLLFFLSHFVSAAITKYRGLGNISKRILFFPVLGIGKFNIKMPPGSLSLQGLYLLMALPVSSHIGRGCQKTKLNQFCSALNWLYFQFQNWVTLHSIEEYIFDGLSKGGSFPTPPPLIQVVLSYSPSPVCLSVCLSYVSIILRQSA